MNEAKNSMRRLAQSDEGGYILAVLLVAMAIAAIWMAASLPAWRQQAQRQRELELKFRGEQYGFLGVRLADFMPAARPLSDSWDTVAMPVGLFRQAARPFDELIHSPAVAPAPLVATGWQALPAGLE